MMKPLTPAQRRALYKACGPQGKVRRSSRPLDAIPDPDWDNPHVIDRVIAKGLLAPGAGFNEYVPTQAGRDVWQRRRVRKKENEE